MKRPTQLCLDDSMLSIADIAINPEAVADLIPWELFEPVREAYERARFQRSKRETKKSNGEAKKRRGRPPKCVRKLFHIAEEELSDCRDEEPGIGGAPPFEGTRFFAPFSSPPYTTARPTRRASGGSLPATRGSCGPAASTPETSHP